MYVMPVSDLPIDNSMAPTCPVPDHSLLVLDVDFYEFSILKNEYYYNQTTSSIITQRYSKQFYVDDIPPGFMSQGPFINDVVNFITDVSSSVDKLYEQYIEMHSNELQEKLCKIKPKQKSNRTMKPFWNTELNDLFKAVSIAERAFYKASASKPDNHEDRFMYKDKRAIFDKNLERQKSKYEKY